MISLRYLVVKGNNILDTPSLSPYTQAMINPTPLPKTLAEAIVYFADADKALAFMVNMRWPKGVACPRCGSDKKPSFLSSRRIWKCSGCRKQFSVKVGTVFEDSPLGLDKWLPALWMLANCRNGVSSYELARTLGVTQKTAWFMLGRIREAMQTKSFEKTTGTVEIDEAFIGGLAANMHRAKRERVMQGAKAGAKGKIGVIAGVRRGANGESSKVVAKVMKNAFAKPHGTIARAMVKPGSRVYTDSATLYDKNLAGFQRETVNHRNKEYVRGDVHTNGVENFWSSLKRAIKGTYISVDPAHLFRYVEEQAFRFNVRGQTEGNRFASALREIVGKRITYAELSGANLSGETA